MLASRRRVDQTRSTAAAAAADAVAATVLSWDARFWAPGALMPRYNRPGTATGNARADLEQRSAGRQSASA
jgi:hypothetical protein